MPPCLRATAVPLLACSVLLFSLPLMSMASPVFGAPCRAGGVASAPFIDSADMHAIDRAVVVLPAVGTKEVPLSIGSVLPRVVATKPVPAAVRKVLPQYAGYRAFRTGMTLVIVDPATRRLSYLLPLRAKGAPVGCP